MYNKSVANARTLTKKEGETWMTDKAKSKMLFEQHKKMTAAWESQMDALAQDESVSEEEYEQKLTELYAQHRAKADAVLLSAFALEFPKRNGWFADVFAPSFGICENKKLSVRQTQIFAKYCVGDDGTWKTGESYCRFADKFARLTKPRVAPRTGSVG